MTRKLAHAAAWDAGNLSMRAAGRTKWNGDDYNAAAREYARLWPIEREEQAAMHDETEAAEYWAGLGVWAAGESGDDCVDAFEAIERGQREE